MLYLNFSKIKLKHSTISLICILHLIITSPLPQSIPYSPTGWFGALTSVPYHHTLTFWFEGPKVSPKKYPNWKPSTSWAFWPLFGWIMSLFRELWAKVNRKPCVPYHKHYTFVLACCLWQQILIILYFKLLPKWSCVLVKKVWPGGPETNYSICCP